MGTPFYVCTARDTLAEIDAIGIADELRASGVEIVADTCVVVTPILPAKNGVLMTNSGKFAHYGPSNTGYDVLYGSLEDCVESAITGESAPVIRESGGDRSAVTGGTVVLSDRIVVRITARQGETFLDRMIALVEGAARQKTPNEIALNILLAGLTIIFLLAVVTLQPFAMYSGEGQQVIVLVALLVCLIPTTIGALLSAIGIAGMWPAAAPYSPSLGWQPATAAPKRAPPGVLKTRGSS